MIANLKDNWRELTIGSFANKLRLEPKDGTSRNVSYYLREAIIESIESFANKLRLDLKDMDIYKSVFFTESVLSFSQSIESEDRLTRYEESFGKITTWKFIDIIIAKLDPNIPKQMRAKEILETIVNKSLGKKLGEIMIRNREILETIVNKSSEKSDIIRDVYTRIDNIEVKADKGAIVQIGSNQSISNINTSPK